MLSCGGHSKDKEERAEGKLADHSGTTVDRVFQIGEDILILSPEQKEMAGIITGKLELMDLSESLLCNGLIEVPPQSKVSLTLPMDAYIRDISAYSGTKLSKGDLLAIAEHPDFLELQRDYLVSSNNLEYLRADLERQETLASENAASGKKLMAARTEYQNTLVLNRSIAEQLRLLGIDPGKLNAENISSQVKVKSPINGYVRLNHANIGEHMQAGEPIMELESMDQMILHLLVYEKDIARVRKGQSVIFSTGSGNRQYRGVVFTAGRSVDESTRSSDVYVEITDPDTELLSGVHVQAKILTGERQVYALPEAGIARKGERTYAFTVHGDSFRRLKVQSGILQNGYVEINLPDLLSDQEFVVEGAYYLNSGFEEEK
jgi:cobalt-zinc-cadmium efflux system membrane fusion protein